MSINLIVDLYNHMQWADATVWTCLLKSTDAQKDSKLQSYFHHLHTVQYVFLKIWKGEPRETPYPEFDNSLALMLWGKAYYKELFAYTDALSDQMLAKEIDLPWAAVVEKRIGVAPKNTYLQDTMLQVAMHSQYHRGQINTRLRELEVEPPLVDYIAWAWLGRPLASWPFTE